MERSEDYEETRWDYSSQTYHSYRDYDKAQILHVSCVKQKLRSATVTLPTVKIAKSIYTRGHFYLILPTRETVTVSLKVGSSCPSFYMDDKRSLSHSQKPRGTQRVCSSPASSPAIFLSLTPQVTCEHPLLRLQVFMVSLQRIPQPSHYMGLPREQSSA